MTFGATDYLEFRFLLFKIGVAGCVAVIAGTALYYLVLNPLIKEFGFFRDDKNGKIGIFGFFWGKITGDKAGGWEGILLTEKEAKLLQTADYLRGEDKKPLAYLVFDYLFCGRFEDAQDITDLYEKKYSDGRVYAMKMLVADAKEKIEAGLPREKIRSDIKMKLAQIFHEE